MKTKICVAGILVVMAGPVFAKDLQDQPPAPQTDLEEFKRQTGVVIIRGYENIGTRSGLESSYIRIEAKEFLSADKRKRKYGVTVYVNSGSKLGRENISYIDYEELDPLIRGMDYLNKIEGSTINFSDYQADYVTKGGLKVTTYSNNDELFVEISSGHILETTAYFPITALSDIKSMVVKAKEKIDAVR